VRRHRRRLPGGRAGPRVDRPRRERGPRVPRSSVQGREALRGPRRAWRTRRGPCRLRRHVALPRRVPRLARRAHRRRAGDALAARDDVAPSRPSCRSRGEDRLRPHLRRDTLSRRGHLGPRERQQEQERPRHRPSDVAPLCAWSGSDLEREGRRPARPVRGDEPSDALHERRRRRPALSRAGRRLPNVSLLRRRRPRPRQRLDGLPFDEREHASTSGVDGLPDPEASQAARSHRPRLEPSRIARARSLLRFRNDAPRRSRGRTKIRRDRHRRSRDRHHARSTRRRWRPLR